MTTPEQPLLNKEGRPYSPNYRIIPGSRRGGVPTNKGLPRSAEHNTKISTSLTGIVHSEHSIDLHRVTWNRVYPLAARNATAQEAADLTGLDQVVVEVALQKRGRKTKKVEEYFTPEWRAERKRRSLNRRSLTMKGEFPDTDSANSASFVKILIEKGLIGEDTTVWKRLNEICASEGYVLDNFPHALMLEVFLAARINASRGDWKLFNEYFELGRQSDMSWFGSDKLNADRKFISNEITGRLNKVKVRKRWNDQKLR